MAKKKRKNKKSRRVLLFIATIFAVWWVWMYFSNHMQAVRLETEIAKKIDLKEQLQRELADLNQKRKEMLSLGEIKEYATKNLGMVVSSGKRFFLPDPRILPKDQK
ncbi:MAG: low temperature requirement protein A [Caldisericales bacterium]|nr:low temperature requirement protein A [Caldisericales bacterium]